jgi:acetyl esterase/lipase
MTKLLLSLFALCLLNPLYAQKSLRYKNEVFVQIDSSMNVPYGASKNIQGQLAPLYLDVYSPHADTLKKRPMVVFVHGGGFVNGDKRTGYSRIVSENLTRRGFVVGSINYRLGIEEPKSNVSYFEAMIRAVQDAKAAVRFFRKNAQAYGIDTTKIYLAGGSAGAMTALQAAYLDQKEVPGFIDIAKNGLMEGTSGNEGFSSKVHGVVNFWGAMVNYAWINQGDVPLFNVHGTADKTVPYDS